MKYSNDPIGNRTRHLPACSAVPQPREERGSGGLLSYDTWQSTSAQMRRKVGLFCQTVTPDHK